MFWFVPLVQTCNTCINDSMSMRNTWHDMFICVINWLDNKITYIFTKKKKNRKNRKRKHSDTKTPDTSDLFDLNGLIT